MARRKVYHAGHLRRCTATRPSRGESKKKLTLLVLLILSLTLSACAAAKFPTGKFVSEDNKSTWQFNPDGTWSLRDASGLPLEGTHTTNGSTYTETSNNSMFVDSENCDKWADYTWSYSNSRLTFQTTTDKCETRKAWYTGASFVLSK